MNTLSTSNSGESSHRSYLLLLRITVAIVTITLVVLTYMLYSSDQMVFAGITGTVALLTLLGGALYLGRIASSITSGEVLQDELTTSRLYKSSYITFNISVIMWLALASFVEEFSEPRYAFYVGIFGMFALLFLTNLVQKSKSYR